MKNFTLMLSALLLPLIASAETNTSPLANYPGFGHNVEADEEQFDREEMAREQLTARCMEKNGFRYTPSVSFPVDELGSPSEAMSVLGEDRNGSYKRRLPDEERRRYDMTLYGVEDPTMEEGIVLSEPDSGGCLGESARTLPGVFAAKAALQEEYDAMRRSALNSPYVKAAESRWAQCMQNLGHPNGDASPRALEERHDAELSRTIGRTKSALPSREVLAQLGRHHRAEKRLTMECALKVDLPGAVAKAQARQETLFVAEHLETLNRHLERFQAQQPVLEQIEMSMP